MIETDHVVEVVYSADQFVFRPRLDDMLQLVVPKPLRRFIDTRQRWKHQLDFQFARAAHHIVAHHAIAVDGGAVFGLTRGEPERIVDDQPRCLDLAPPAAAETDLHANAPLPVAPDCHLRKRQ